jgi:hypothetical protein
MRGDVLWVFVGLGLHVLALLCQVGVALDTAALICPCLTWIRGRSARAHLEVPEQGLASTGDSNGTGRGVPLGATSGSGSVDISWQELLDAISDSSRGIRISTGESANGREEPWFGALGEPYGGCGGRRVHHQQVSGRL